MKIEYGLLRWRAEGYLRVCVEPGWITDRTYSEDELEKSMTDPRDRVFIRGSVHDDWIELKGESIRRIKLLFLLRGQKLPEEIIERLIRQLGDLIEEEVEYVKGQAHVAW